MLDILNKNKTAQPKELLDRMKDEVDGFTGDGDLFDDVTMMSLVWKA